MNQDLDIVIRNIASRAKEFVIFVIPQIDFEPFKNLYKRIALRKIDSILVYSGNGISNITKYKWAQEKLIIKTSQLNHGYIISEKTAISFHKSELSNYPNWINSVSRPYSENYLSKLQELQRHVNFERGIYDFSIHVDLKNNFNMKGLHSNLLFKFKYEIDDKDYYYSTYKLFCVHVVKLYPNRYWGSDVFHGRNIISMYFKIDKEIYEDLYSRLSKLGQPYQFELNDKVHF